MRLQTTTPSLAIKSTMKAITLYRNKKSSQWQDVAKEESTTELYRTFRQFGDMSAAGIVNEGEDFPVTDFDSPYSANIYPNKKGLAFENSTEAMESEQGFGILSSKVPMLSMSLNKTLEYGAANKILNNATSTAAAFIGMDGKALAATDHPYDGGTWSNRGVSSVDITLGAANLEAAIEQLGYQVTHKGDPFPFVGPFNLYVTGANAGLANRLFKSQNVAQSDHNDPNWAGQQIAKVVVMRYATGSTTHWALRSADDDEHGITLLRKRAVRIRQFDLKNDMTLTTISEIYAYFHQDARGFWYSAGA